MFCWACHRNSGLSDDQQNRNAYYHRIVKGLQAHFLLSSTTQVSILSRVWFTNAQCIYWNKNQLNFFLTYMYSKSNQSRGYFFNLRCFHSAFAVFKVFKAVSLELFIVKKTKKNYRYYSFQGFSWFYSELFLAWMFWS